MAYQHGAPWYYAADGTPVQAVATEEGWTYDLAPVDDDGRHVQVIDDPAQVLQLNTQALGFNPDDKIVNPDQSVSIMNPQTQAYEPAVAAGESGALMPLSMAQEQQLPIYQYAQEPQDTGTLGQIMDLATPPLTLAAIAAAANFAGGNIPDLSSIFGGGAAETAPAAATSVAETFPLAAQTMPTAVELGAGGVGSAAWELPGLTAVTEATTLGGGATGLEWLAGGADPMGAALTIPEGIGMGTAAAGGAATAATSATEEAMLQAARTQQLNTIAGNGMTGMASGIATGLPGLVQSGMDALGVTPGVASTVGNVLGGAATAAGGYQIPWGQIAGGLMEYAGANEYADKMSEAMKYAVDKADPFASQRPFYQGELSKMFTDSNYFNNSPLLKGANQNAISDTSRALASQGYNMSGNVPMEIAQRLQNNNMTYGLDLMNKTGGYAGAGFGPGQAGTIAAAGGNATAQAGQQGMGALGSIFQNVLQGQQPTSAQQVQGTQPNQTLQQYLFA